MWKLCAICGMRSRNDGAVQHFHEEGARDEGGDVQRRAALLHPCCGLTTMLATYGVSNPLSPALRSKAWIKDPRLRSAPISERELARDRGRREPARPVPAPCVPRPRKLRLGQWALTRSTRHQTCQAFQSAGAAVPSGAWGEHALPAVPPWRRRRRGSNRHSTLQSICSRSRGCGRLLLSFLGPDYCLCLQR